MEQIASCLAPPAQPPIPDPTGHPGEAAESRLLVLGGGDPLVRPDVLDVASLAARLGLRVVIATNGTTIDRSLARRIGDAGVGAVSVSLDGPTASVHDSIRQVSGAFDRAVSGIEHLAAERVPLWIHTRVTKNNVGALDPLIDLAARLGCVEHHLFPGQYHPCGLEVPSGLRLDADGVHAVVELARRRRPGLVVRVACLPHQAKYGPAPVVDRPGLTDEVDGWPSEQCLAGTAMVAISPDGSVYPCPNLGVRLGHVTDRTLARIWSETPLLADLRSRGRLTGRCSTCALLVACGGCRAGALASCGDMWGDDPSCRPGRPGPAGQASGRRPCDRDPRSW